MYKFYIHSAVLFSMWDEVASWAVLEIFWLYIYLDVNSECPSVMAGYIGKINDR